MSIRDELAEDFYDAYRVLNPGSLTWWTEDEYHKHRFYAQADIALASPVIRRIQAEALRQWADEMDNTDDPDWIHVANGNIDLWLHCVADRIERGE